MYLVSIVLKPGVYGTKIPDSSQRHIQGGSIIEAPCLLTWLQTHGSVSLAFDLLNFYYLSDELPLPCDWMDRDR